MLGTSGTGAGRVYSSINASASSWVRGVGYTGATLMSLFKLIASLAFVAALVGCTSAPAAPTSAPQSAPTTASAPAAAAGGAPVEISLHYPVGVSGPLAKIIDGYMAQFNQENPSIKVTPVYDGDYAAVAAKVLQLQQAGTPADVGIVNAAAIYLLTDADAVIPLDDLIAQNGGDAYI